MITTPATDNLPEIFWELGDIIGADPEDHNWEEFYKYYFDKL